MIEIEVEMWRRVIRTLGRMAGGLVGWVWACQGLSAYHPPFTEVTADVVTNEFDVVVRFQVFDPDLQLFRLNSREYEGQPFDHWIVSDLETADGLVAWRARRIGAIAPADTLVGYAVYDPALQRWVVDEHTYEGTSQSFWTASLLRTAEGVVVWRATMGGSGALRDAEVAYSTYDAGRRKWVQHERRYIGSTLNFWTITNLTLVDQVVAWKADVAGANSWFDSELGMATYDPTQGAWMETEQRYDGTSLNFWITAGPVVANRLVAWKAQTQGLASAYDVEAGFAVYDPSRHAWRKGTRRYDGQLNNVWSVSLPTIANHRVQWSAARGLDLTTEVRGYQWTNGVWERNYTAPLAFFAASRTTGAPPLRVWFCDLSLGANIWSWDLGDGSSSLLRHPYHVYNEAGPFVVTQTVRGPRGTNSASLTLGGVPGDEPVLFESGGLLMTPQGLRMTLTNLTPGRSVVIEASPDCLQWVPIATNTPSTNRLEFLDLQAGAVGRRLYRVRVP